MANWRESWRGREYLGGGGSSDLRGGGGEGEGGVEVEGKEGGVSGREDGGGERGGGDSREIDEEIEIAIEIFAAQRAR